MCLCESARARVCICVRAYVCVRAYMCARVYVGVRMYYTNSMPNCKIISLFNCSKQKASFGTRRELIHGHVTSLPQFSISIYESGNNKYRLKDRSELNTAQLGIGAIVLRVFAGQGGILQSSDS